MKNDKSLAINVREALFQSMRSVQCFMKTVSILNGTKFQQTGEMYGRLGRNKEKRD